MVGLQEGQEFYWNRFFFSVFRRMVLTLGPVGTSGYLRESWIPCLRNMLACPAMGSDGPGRGREVGSAALKGTMAERGQNELTMVVLCQNLSRIPHVSCPHTEKTLFLSSEYFMAELWRIGTLLIYTSSWNFLNSLLKWEIETNNNKKRFLFSVLYCGVLGILDQQLSL